jgi:hypothetical protein
MIVHAPRLLRPHPLIQGFPDTRDNVYRLFVARVRDNLHIVLAMSPVGDSFRVRCRQFPSLINCTTIDWFMPWPDEALFTVANRFLAEEDLGGDEVGGCMWRARVWVGMADWGVVVGCGGGGVARGTP